MSPPADPRAAAAVTMAEAPAVAPRAAPVQTPLRRFLSEFAESKVAVSALFVLVAIVLAALLAPWIAPQNPYDLAQISILDGRLEPGSESMDGWTFWLGTDDQGRDMVSAILYGLRISLGVGVTSGMIAVFIGLTVGMIAAYFGGKVDTVIMRVVDLQLSFPAILVALILLAVLGTGVDKIIIALVVVQWAYYARTVRASSLVERRKEYMEAAHCLALPTRRILFRHMLPNVLPPLIVVATVQVAHAISLEATLSFLGLGVQPPTAELGSMAAEGRNFLFFAPHVSTVPSVAIFLVVLAFNVLGDAMRDVLDPRLRQ